MNLRRLKLSVLEEYAPLRPAGFVDEYLSVSAKRDGDDIFVTQVERIAQGIEQDAANCVLIKPNQVGTLTETYDAVRLAHTHGLDTVMSHRSGETTDTTIAHLATAFSCVFLKCGAVGGERIAKLNELIRIEEQL